MNIIDRQIKEEDRQGLKADELVWMDRSLNMMCVQYYTKKLLSFFIFKIFMRRH